MTAAVQLAHETDHAPEPEPKLTPWELRVMTAIHERTKKFPVYGATAQLVQRDLDRTARGGYPGQVSSAFTRLIHKGALKKTGRHHFTDSGKRTAVHVLTEYGRLRLDDWLAGQSKVS